MIWLGNVRFALLLLLGIIAGGFYPGTLLAEQQVRLKNGMALNGLILDITSLNQNPFAAAAGGGGVQTRPIMLVDNGLTRIYIHRNGMVVGDPIDVRGVDSLIEFEHPVPLGGQEVKGIGSILGVSPFNEFGRRAINLRGPEGAPITIFQGIKELNPRYAKIQALKGTPSYLWDMRVATSSLDSESLRKIFKRRFDQDDVDQRLEAVRFFIESQRYADAHEELEQVIADLPQAANMRAQLISITEFQATQLIEEAKARAKVGQEEFAANIYKEFPLNAVGRVTRLEVQDGLKKLQATSETASTLVKQLRAQAGQLNAAQAGALGPIINEIEAGLSAATLPRMSDYLRLGNADAIPLDNRVALAVAGWLLGPGSGEQNLTIVIALIKIRALVSEYLGSGDPARRKAILDELRNLEGAEPDYVARMLPLLLPPLPWPDGSESTPGMHTVVGDPGEDPLRVVPRYVIQLPPEYDPLREYPCILALHPPSAAPEQQIDWWAGPVDAEVGGRHGHATRHGYIVVAPLWTRPNQRVYEYTPREHQRVLVSLRDAMRRASIDADRVFIVGHGEGGTAAWDIAVSHPDIWAGMIAVSAEPRKTLTHYFPNAEHVPLYLVMGELDGAPAPLIRNGPVLDDYVKVRNDAMVVMYRGRGREFFFEEVHRMFDWMNLPAHVRKDIPQDIDTVTMREGDTFFWWLELDGLKPGTATDPILWDQAERIRGKLVSASVGAENQIRIGQGPTDRFTVWLRPGMGIDMSKGVTVRYRSRRVDLDFDGNLEAMLEDTRQRADRKRPFWAKVVIP